MEKHVSNLYKELIKTNETCADLAKITYKALKQVDRRFTAGLVACMICVAIIENRRSAMQREIDILKTTVKELSGHKEE